MSNENTNQNESAINLGDIFRTLWKNIVLIIIITLCFLVVGAVYTFAIAKEKYTSRASFVVSISTSTGTGTGSASDDYDYTNSLRLIGTVVDLVKEDVVLDSVAEEYDLSLSALSSMVTVNSSTTSFIISVAVESPDPELSKKLANAVVDRIIYVADNVEGFDFISNTLTQTSFAKDGVYSSPNKVLYLAVSFLVGAVVGCVVVFVREFLSTKFKTRNDIENILDEKIIGYLPENKEEAAKSKGKKDKHGKRIHLVPTLLEPGTINYEPYNNLLTNIKYSQLEKPYKVIMCTSSHEGELKSTVISNLASCIKFNNQKVIIIDLDLRKSVMHKVFKLHREPGIVDYLAGEKTKEEVINHTESGVDVITVGKKIPNPIAVIENEKLKKLIEELAAEYDYVLLDAPPVLACSDANSISKICDGVLFNVSMNDVTKKEAASALESLRLVGARIVGINVTKGVVDKHSSGYYYYHYYGSDGESDNHKKQANK